MPSDPNELFEKLVEAGTTENVLKPLRSCLSCLNHQLRLKTSLTRLNAERQPNLKTFTDLLKKKVDVRILTKCLTNMFFSIAYPFMLTGHMSSILNQDQSILNQITRPNFGDERSLTFSYREDTISVPWKQKKLRFKAGLRIMDMPENGVRDSWIFFLCVGDGLKVMSLAKGRICGMQTKGHLTYSNKLNIRLSWEKLSGGSGSNWHGNWTSHRMRFNIKLIFNMVERGRQLLFFNACATTDFGNVKIGSACCT
ncbi:uncharacterized protein EV154DRAFT_477572 [Mucor mucedo]|uniref:uncharacterized protein n=1 Tax=Mucor mucedo TaxID=29922 RepID=UPI0022207D29|nr:uncharacterized protein EV154DRAFT_477572 [Mucor mucedo]KAI7895124.1 hypothetical protein EV154DRAFT_477572 [Mucor mucedo]